MRFCTISLFGFYDRFTVLVVCQVTFQLLLHTQINFWL